VLVVHCEVQDCRDGALGIMLEGGPKNVPCNSDNNWEKKHTEVIAERYG
jgi:hypothetical protein